MKIRRQFYLAIFAIAFLLSVLFSCAQQPPAPLRVGTTVWPGLESFYLARDLGYYKDTPIKFVEYPSDSEVLRAYRSGELEAATLTMDEVFQLATTDPKIRIVLLTDTSNGADVILGKPEIKNLQGLKGRSVGVESSALGAFMLTRALSKVGMSPKDVRALSLEVSEHEQAFKKGTVDAVVTFEPVRTKLLAAGAKVLFDSSQIPGEVVDVLAVREQVLNSQLTTVDSLVKGWFHALDYFHQHPEDAAAKMAPREQVTAQQFLQSLKGLRIPDLQENQKLLSKTDPTLINGAKDLSKVMVDNHLLQSGVDPAPILDDRIVKTVKI